MVFTRLLPRWLGWTTIVYSLAGLGLFAVTRDMPPLFHSLLPIVMGSLLLLRRSQLPTVSRQKEKSAVASTTAVE